MKGRNLLNLLPPELAEEEKSLFHMRSKPADQVGATATEGCPGSAAILLRDRKDGIYSGQAGRLEWVLNPNRRPGKIR